jgi:hypothetical protein
MPLYFSQTAEKEPLELYGNVMVMIMVMVVVIMMMTMSLFGGNQCLVYATCEV